MERRTEGKPTQIVDDFWVWVERGRFSGGDYTGKWMLFYDLTVLDEKWDHVKSLYEQGLLGENGLAKCSTARSNPNATSKKSGVIIIYTPDFRDQETVYDVAVVLHEKLSYKGIMYYKTDAQTHAGLYASQGSKKNHIYRYPL
ncbi:hypothetical protein BGZ76_003737 [Entomortierella beljakovae]|nr:hypothetical protein BGZ76_003737 [Entomortierella beljakovae]